MSAVITQLWRYPVKSMGGEQLAAASFDRLGVIGDRRYAVVDVAENKVLSARREKRLLMASARTEANGEVVLALPDGRVLSASDPGAHSVLGQWLGREVKLIAAGTGGTDESRDWVKGMGAGSVPLDARHEDGSTSELPARWWDSSPLLIVTEEELAELGEQLGDVDEGPALVRRFRPSLVVRVSRTVQGADRPSFRVRKRAPRCVVTTHPQPGLAQRRSVLQTVAQCWNGDFGTYAYVDDGTRLRLGDPLPLATPLTYRAGSQ